MKKISYIVLALLFVFAGLLVVHDTQATGTTTQAVVYSTPNAVPYTQPMVLVLATSTSTTQGPGVGNTYTLSLPMRAFTCVSLVTNSTPSTETVKIEGSIDGGTNWVPLITNLATASSYTYVNNMAVTRIRGNWSILTGATGTFTTSVTCQGQQM